MKVSKDCDGFVIASLYLGERFVVYYRLSRLGAFHVL